MAKSNPFTMADLEAKGFVKSDDGSYVKGIGKTPYEFPLIDNYKLHESTIPSNKVKVKKSNRPKGIIPKPDPIGLTAIKNVLKATNIPFEIEYKFHPERKWRFDFAIIDKKIAIEFEGIFSKKSRHTTVMGYTNDLTKYNAGVALGWSILRYSAANYKNFIEDLKLLL